MVKLGAALAITGLFVILGYGAFALVLGLYLSDAPLILRVAIFSLLLGIVVLLITLSLERLRAKKHEGFKEFEH